MTEHTRNDLEKLSRMARKTYSTSLMSDTKWRKVFTVLNVFDITKVDYHWIDTDRTLRAGPPNGFGLHAPHAWFEPDGSPCELRAIERVTFFFENSAQKAEAIEALKAVGQFDLEPSGEAPTLFGYR